MSTAVEIDVEARRVRVNAHEWRPWTRAELLAFNDGRLGQANPPTTGIADITARYYRAFYDCGVAAARVAQGTGGEAA